VSQSQTELSEREQMLAAARQELEAERRQNKLLQMARSEGEQSLREKARKLEQVQTEATRQAAAADAARRERVGLEQRCHQLESAVQVSGGAGRRWPTLLCSPSTGCSQGWWLRCLGARWCVEVGRAAQVAAAATQSGEQVRLS
jgi:hypothetical protein